MADFATVEDYQLVASKRGITLPENETEQQIQLDEALLFIDSLEPRLRGTRATRDQEHAYPRSELVINGFTYDSDEIPYLVIRAQIELALEINSGIDLYAQHDGLPVTKERVEGAVEVQYAAPSKTEQMERDSVAMRLIKQLMRPVSRSIPIVRV